MNEIHPLISCLCVTENRAAFMPWLLRAYDSQSYRNRELVIIDSSETPFDAGNRKDIRVLTMPSGTWVPEKRNKAMEEARGEIIAWFDDDDWQHPDRLKFLIQDLLCGAPYVGPNKAWFIDLFTLGCERFSTNLAIFNGSGYWKEAVLPFPFDVQKKKASDTDHLKRIIEKHGFSKTLSRTLFSWLSHEKNISNPRHSRTFSDSLEDVKSNVGEKSWGDTSLVLEGLRKQLA